MNQMVMSLLGHRPCEVQPWDSMPSAAGFVKIWDVVVKVGEVPLSVGRQDVLRPLAYQEPSATSKGILTASK